MVATMWRPFRRARFLRGIGIAIGGNRMTFGHEQLDVYRTAIEYVAWAFRLCEHIKVHRSAKDQLLRASQSIPLNIAEGNGKPSEGERRRYFEIARGSALECAAIQDVLEVCGALSAAENANAKKLLDRKLPCLQNSDSAVIRSGKYRVHTTGTKPKAIAPATPVPIPT